MKTPTRTVVKHLLAATLLLGSAATAVAQSSYPSQPITFIVGYTPGGLADAVARSVAKGLSESMKATVVVDNKPGADSLIAAELAAQQPADGYTLLLATDAMTTINPQLPGAKKIDMAATFEPVVNMVTGPLILAASKNLPANSLAELIALGKKDPELLNFGTSGNATPHRMTGELLQQLGGFKMTHVAYKGTSASVTDLAGGHIELVVGNAGALMPLVQTDKIKLLAVASQKRFPLIPNVPAVSETFPGFNMATYFGVVVRKGTPPEIVTKLNEEINKVLSPPEMRDALLKQGVTVLGGTPGDFQAEIDADTKLRGKLIQDLKITAE